MKIMGMTNRNYYLSWFIRYFLTYSLIHLLATIIISLTLSFINPVLLFITFILFDVVLIVQSFFVQVFFEKAKMGVVVGLVFFVGQYVVNFVVRTAEEVGAGANVGVSVAPHAAFVLFFVEYLFCVSNRYVLGWKDVAVRINGYSVATAWVSFVANIVFWGLLTVYLEQVFPNEWGAKKSPLFFLDYLRQKPQNTTQPLPS